jgi:hypothetical protein
MYLFCMGNDADADSVREAVASAGGDERQALEILRSAYRNAQEGTPAAIVRISFRNHFADTTETVSFPCIPWLPDEQAALQQVTRPLHFIKAAVWSLARQSPAAGTKRLRQQPLPPLDCVRNGCPAHMPARLMFGWVRRLAGGWPPRLVMCW